MCVRVSVCVSCVCVMCVCVMCVCVMCVCLCLCICVMCVCVCVCVCDCVFVSCVCVCVCVRERGELYQTSLDPPGNFRQPHNPQVFVSIALSVEVFKSSGVVQIQQSAEQIESKPSAFSRETHLG